MGQVFKLLFLDVVWDIVYFPIWWYSQGFLGTAKWVRIKIVNLSRSLGLSVWIKNLFRPMYGQRDIAGQIISFFMRSVQIIFRTIILVIGSVWFLFLLFVWLAAPIIVLAQLF